MEIEIVIDRSLKTPKVVVYTSEITKEITELVERLGENDASSKRILGYADGQVIPMKHEQIVHFYTQEQKVYARSEGNVVMQVKNRIYELEEMLSGTSFIRISQAEIVNFDRVKSLEWTGSGMVCMRLEDGNTTFVARRYVDKIKKYLGM